MEAKNNEVKRVGRNLWGWFVVCVWIVGVPNVVKYSYMGIKGAAAETQCMIIGCNSSKAETPKTEPSGSADLLETLSEAEYAELRALQKARRAKGS